ncbi:MAG: methyltransferase domain-containing protein [Thalassobaculaceae bacterium]|nr:methyltransferase domain-containing protein [Thalassobaculaceae bacterium]
MSDVKIPAEGLTEAVKRFYETYPYPRIDPGRSVQSTILGTPWCAAHHALDNRISKRVRILVAGGGTGVALEALGVGFAAEGVTPDIVYVDLSQASAAEAKRRAERVGLSGVRFLIQSIESLAKLDLEPFDYIDFSGVLNHVAEPAPVLKVLSDLLSPGGGIGIMVYGRLGRTGIYPMQNALRLLNGAPGAGDPVDTMRSLLGNLPAENWITKNPHLGDGIDIPTIELADRYLNPNDRAFEIGEMEALLRAVGMKINGFVSPFLYDPLPLLPSEELKAQARAMSMIERAQLSEWLSGTLHIHQFFAVPAARPTIDPEAFLTREDTRLMPSAFGEAAFEALSRAAGRIMSITMPYGGLKLTRKARFTDDESRVLQLLKAGPSVGAVRDLLAGEGVDRARSDAAILGVYRVMSQLGAVHIWAAH